MVDVNWAKQNQRKPTLDLSTKGREGKSAEDETPAKQKAKPVGKASPMVLCLRCKEECGIQVSHEEVEQTFRFGTFLPIKWASPSRNYQPASPREKERMESPPSPKDSNLFKKLKAAAFEKKQEEKATSERKNILTKPYIPPAPAATIKEGKWYTREKGKVVEISSSRKRKLQRRFGEAKRTLEALDQGLIKPSQLVKSPEQYQKEMEALAAKPLVAPRSLQKQASGTSKPSVFYYKSFGVKVLGASIMEYRLHYISGSPYYNGTIIFQNSDTKEVSFIPFDKGEGKKVRDIYTYNTNICDERVLRPWYVSYCEDICKHIICYDRFHYSLRYWLPRWNKFNSVKDAYGLPHSVIKTQISKLLKSVNNIHKSGLLHLSLSDISNYVVIDNNWYNIKCRWQS